MAVVIQLGLAVAILGAEGEGQITGDAGGGDGFAEGSIVTAAGDGAVGEVYPGDDVAVGIPRTK